MLTGGSLPKSPSDLNGLPAYLCYLGADCDLSWLERTAKVLTNPSP